MDHNEKRLRDYKTLMGEQVKALSKKPLINENTSPFSLTYDDLRAGKRINTTPQTSNSPLSYKELWRTFLNSPEAIAPCDTIITDIISDGYTIRPIKEGDQAAVKRATEFLESNCFKTKILPSHLLDELVTGDAYVYNVKVKEAQLVDAVKAIVRKLPLRTKDKTLPRQYLYYKLMDEDIFRTKQMINIASETVTIAHDEHGNVSKYVQKVGSNHADFTPQEIIHFKYMDLNGKVYGFCPLKAILPELTMLADIKDAAGNSFTNGGYPAHIFNLEEEVPNSPNVKFLQQQLLQLKENVLEHSNLITTGKVRVENFETITATMQYRELMDQMTRIVYTVWGVPSSKMGQASEGGGGAYDSGLATEGYYRRIAHWQDKIYSIYNSQLFIPEFKVEIIPNKSYLQDELKETQMLKQKFDIAQQGWNNNWFNEAWVQSFLEIDPRFVGTFEKPEPEMGSNFRQGDMKKGDVEGNTAKKEINKMKSDTQKGKQAKAKPQVKALLEKGYTQREIEAILDNETL